MASTYPLDVVQANRWLKDHEDLEGEALQKAVDEEAWDDSVKALVFFPSVLEFMSDNLDWTQDLGDAVLAQQGDLTDTIQRLRGEADKAGALASNEAQRVEKSGDTIIIQPAQPEVVYVPTYDPVKVYGAEQSAGQDLLPRCLRGRHLQLRGGLFRRPGRGRIRDRLCPERRGRLGPERLPEHHGGGHVERYQHRHPDQLRRRRRGRGAAHRRDHVGRR